MDFRDNVFCSSEWSDARQEINTKLLNISWFLDSPPPIRSKLLSLPEDCNGFLDDLCTRPTEGGGVRLLHIQDVLIPPGRIFGIFVNFKVESVIDPALKYCYQYFSWKQGSLSGAKGLVLICHNDRITDILCLRAFSFAVGAEVFDLPGGFLEDSDEFRVDLRFVRELFEEIGLSLTDHTLIDLGRCHVDSGMTNNCPRLFAVVVTIQDLARLNQHHTNPDSLELHHRSVIIPVSQLWGSNGLIEKHSSGMFGTCIARLVNRGLLFLP